MKDVVIPAVPPKPSYEYVFLNALKRAAEQSSADLISLDATVQALGSTSRAKGRFIYG